MSQNKYLISVWIRMKTFTSNVLTFFLGEVFLFDFVYQCIVHTSKISGGQYIPVDPVHCSRDLQTFFFLTTFSLKMSSMILFTHLKIILLQCFQFSAK